MSRVIIIINNNTKNNYIPFVSFFHRNIYIKSPQDHPTKKEHHHAGAVCQVYWHGYCKQGKTLAVTPLRTQSLWCILPDPSFVAPACLKLNVVCCSLSGAHLRPWCIFIIFFWCSLCCPNWLNGIPPTRSAMVMQPPICTPHCKCHIWRVVVFSNEMATIKCQDPSPLSLFWWIAFKHLKQPPRHKKTTQSIPGTYAYNLARRHIVQERPWLEGPLKKMWLLQIPPTPLLNVVNCSTMCHHVSWRFYKKWSEPTCWVCQLANKMASFTCHFKPYLYKPDNMMWKICNV